MKIHSDNFKETIKSLGRMQDVRITYTLNDKQLILDGENINSITPNYEASLLKSVMKGLDLDSNIDIPLGTEIKFEYGLLINGVYEYLDYGNYIVYSSEKQEDTLSYKITCYDKMLYSMKDYEHIDIPYPCTIKQYLVALCNKIGLQFKDSDFANANRQISSELFMTINEDGTYSSMGYTYRDVLDQIAEVTGGCICMTLDDKVEVRYVNKTINYEQSEKSNIIQFKTEVEEPIILERLEGKSIQATRSGKNLLNLLKCSFSMCTLNSDNKSLTCSINNYYYASVKTTELNNWLLQNKGKKITFSTGTTLEGKNTGIVIFGTRSDGSTYQEATETGTGKCSITIADDFTAITSIELRFNRQRTTFTDTTTVINYAMLELGAVATDYEEYGVMPSPDYPSEIENIEGNIEIKVEGKNKFDGEFEIAEYDSSGNKATTKVWAVNKNIINVKPNITYTVSQKENPTQYRIICFNDNEFLQWITSTQDLTNGHKSYTFTTPENCNKIYIQFRSTLEVIATGTYDMTTDSITEAQLEEGELTQYEPYFSKDYVIPLSQPLRSLPNGTKDTIEEDGIHRKIYYISSYNNEELPSNVYEEINGIKYCNDKSMSSTGQFSIGAEVQYELSEEVVEPFTEEQLEVINSMVTEKGTNIFEFPSDTIISYPINYDTIDEEYINDTNVNFGEKYRTY